MLLQQLYMFVGLRLIALSFGHAMFYLKRWPDCHSEIFQGRLQFRCRLLCNTSLQWLNWILSPDLNGLLGSRRAAGLCLACLRRASVALLARLCRTSRHCIKGALGQGLIPSAHTQGQERLCSRGFKDGGAYGSRSRILRRFACFFRI